MRAGPRGEQCRQSVHDRTLGQACSLVMHPRMDGALAGTSGPFRVSNGWTRYSERMKVTHELAAGVNAIGPVIAMLTRIVETPHR